MKNFKTVVAVMAVLMLFAVGCSEPVESAGTTSITLNPNAADVSLVSTNLGFDVVAAAQLIAQNNAMESGTALPPFIRVQKSELFNTSSQPYLTFTFSENIKGIQGGTSLGGGEVSRSFRTDDVIITDVDRGAMAIEGYEISGATLQIVLPTIFNNSPVAPETLIGDDDVVFENGKKYAVDFWVITESGKFGRVLIGFEVIDGVQTVDSIVNLRVQGEADETAGDYVMYLIDSNKAFFLNPGTPADHQFDAVEAESIKVGTVTVTGTDINESLTHFNSYDRRTGSTSISGSVYPNLNSLAANSRVSNLIALNWDEIENVSHYKIYTNAAGNVAEGWQYIETITADQKNSTYANGYTVNLTSFNAGSDRWFRVVPFNGSLQGTHAAINVRDEVHPVTDSIDRSISVDELDIAANFSSDQLNGTHAHGNAAAEGEWVSVNTIDLLAPLTRTDLMQEGIYASDVSGEFNAEITGTIEHGAIIGVTAADLALFNQDIIANEATDYMIAKIMGNTIGVLNKRTSQLEVFVHLKCYIPPTHANQSLIYDNTNTIVESGNGGATNPGFTVTYRDMSNNPIIARDASSQSKVTGELIWVETP